MNAILHIIRKSERNSIVFGIIVFVLVDLLFWVIGNAPFRLFGMLATALAGALVGSLIWTLYGKRKKRNDD